MPKVQYLEVTLSESALGAGVVLEALLEVVQKSLRSLATRLEGRAGFLGTRLLRGTEQQAYLLEVTWANTVPEGLEGWPLELQGVRCRAWVFDVLEVPTTS